MELQIGRVIKPHGIRGEVVVEPTTDEPELRFAEGEVLHARQNHKQHELTIQMVRAHQGRLLVKFEEIPDRTQADSLRGARFFAAPLASEDEDAYYEHELVGLSVRQGAEEVGEVTGAMHMPNRMLLEVQLQSGKEALVPFVQDIVPEVNLAEGYLRITPPEGLLEL